MCHRKQSKPPAEKDIPENLFQFPRWVSEEVTCSVCGKFMVLGFEDNKSVGKCGDGYYVTCPDCGSDAHFTA